MTVQPIATSSEQTTKITTTMTMLMMKFCMVTVRPVFALGEYDDDDDNGDDGDEESSHSHSESSVFALRELCIGGDRAGGTCGRLWSSLMRWQGRIAKERNHTQCSYFL